MCDPSERPTGEVEGGGGTPHTGRGGGGNPLNRNSLSSHMAHKRVRGGHPPNQESRGEEEGGDNPESRGEEEVG